MASDQSISVYSIIKRREPDRGNCWRADDARERAESVFAGWSGRAVEGTMRDEMVKWRLLGEEGRETGGGGVRMCLSSKEVMGAEMPCNASAFCFFLFSSFFFSPLYLRPLLVVRPVAVLPLCVFVSWGQKGRKGNVLLRHYARPGPLGHLKERCRQNLSPGLGGLWPPGGRFAGETASDGVLGQTRHDRHQNTPKRGRRQNANGRAQPGGCVRNECSVCAGCSFVLFVLFRRCMS